MSTNSLTEAAARGVLWATISRFLSQALFFITTAVLARFLLPEHFGVVRMASLFIGLMTVISDQGLSAAIIQRQSLADHILPTAFWLSLGMGVIFFLVSVVASPLVAAFFNNAQVQYVVAVSAASFLIVPLGTVHRGLLNRELAYRKLAYSEIGGTVAYTLIAIGLATAGGGVWSIVIGGLVNNLVAIVILWQIYPWRPKLSPSKEELRKLFSFSSYVIGTNIFNYLGANVDYVFVGRLLGSAELGYYTLAYTIATIPQNSLTPVLGRVSLPALSRIQNEEDRLQRGYLKLVAITALVTFPLLAGMMVVAPHFVRVVYGVQWLNAITPLQLLCVAGAIYAIGSMMGPALLAKGRPDATFLLSLIRLLSLSAFVALGVKFGINGVAASISLYTLSLLFVFQAVVNRTLRMKMLSYLKALWPAVFGSAVMIGVVLTARLAFNAIGVTSDWARLVGLSLLGALTYLACIWLLFADSLFEIFNLLRQVLITSLSWKSVT